MVVLSVFLFQIQLTSLSSIKNGTNSVNPSPRILDSAVTEFHFIRTAYRGVTDTASLQRGQLKYVRGHRCVGQDEPTKNFQIFLTFTMSSIERQCQIVRKVCV